MSEWSDEMFGTSSWADLSRDREAARRNRRRYTPPAPRTAAQINAEHKNGLTGARLAEHIAWTSRMAGLSGRRLRGQLRLG